MASDLFKKLKLWEKDDKVEETQNARIGRLEESRITNSRLDILMGSFITSVIWCTIVLILDGLGIL